MDFMVYLDLDGVIVDFSGGLHRLIGKSDTEATRDEIRECMRTPYFFRNLNPISGSLAEVAELERLLPGQLRILSAVPHSEPTLADVARVEKVAWLEEHLPWLASDAMIVTSKAGVGSEEDILLDDHTWNGASEFSGTLILFTGPESWVTLKTLIQERKTAQPDEVKLARLMGA